jgi:zona occludens toxin (predicted ATPase)
MNFIKCKVILHLTDGREIWGNVFLQSDDRLQDLLNDGRKFIPVIKIDESRNSAISKDKAITVIIHKDAILTIEER